MRRRPRHRRTAFALLVPVALVATLLIGAPAIPDASATPIRPDYSGSDLWLHYPKIEDPALKKRYAKSATTVIVQNAGKNPVHRHTRDLPMEPGAQEHLVTTPLEAAKDELARGLNGLLGKKVPVHTKPGQRIPDGAIVVGTPESSQIVRRHVDAEQLRDLGDEGYLIRSASRGRHDFTLIAANSEIGALYGTFAFLRRMQTQQPITDLDITEKPRIAHRYLNYWETERLYAGNDATGTGGLNGENGAVFNFAATGESADRNLPLILDRYLVVARALASVGVNGITINNVNADNAYLTREYVEQTAALADALRPYGIKVGLSVKYTAPTDERFAPDTLTEDQLDPYGEEFRDWWHRKAKQIQEAIPDFIGFTVKANSEGQPGPQDFGYDHGDGANGIAAALEPLGMTVYWRTFVYNADVDNDRLKRAYLEFGPIDDEPQDDGSVGRFADNVFLQTKNGPLDFQAREPFNPMFGRLENTNQALELQITQEYTGQNTMLCYLGPMWQEVLNTDTYATDAAGELLDKRLVGNVVDGTAQGHSDTAIVGVANLGNADNLTGHHFSQANLFAFGRLAWDWTQDSADIATDWVRMTWSNDDHVVDTIVRMMMGSWEALVSYQTPLGVAHQFADGEHYKPYPSQWFMKDDWSPVYYNKADSVGLGYDRSPTGSNFTAQYFPVLAERYGDIESTPENLLMWFHHVPWDRPMASGRIFWDELVHRYQMGVQYVTWMRETWDSLKPFIDDRRWREVRDKLAQHEIDAADWRDTNVQYWQEFSGREIPVDDGPVSATFVVNGTEHGGFDLSADSYRIPVPAGGSPEITEVRTADPDADYEIVSQADGVPGTALVKVTGRSFFGPLVKNYVLELVPDTTLESLSVNGTRLDSFDPDVHHYNALLPSDVDSVATVEAVAHDPAATVHIEQAEHPTGRAVVTVTNGGASSEYTVDLDIALSGSDEFDSDELDERWEWVRHDPDATRLDDGALVIIPQRGGLETGTEPARNIALQEVNGDWTAESKLVFSRPLAHENEQGGLIAYADDDNYVKLAWEMADEDAEINKLHVVLLAEEDGKATSLEVTGADAQRIVGEDGAIWLRLTKSGDTYKAYYSNDGEVYRYFGTTTLSAEPERAGLMARSGDATATDLEVAFDWFRIHSRGDRVPAR